MARKSRPTRSTGRSAAKAGPPARSGGVHRTAIPREHGRFDYSAIVDRPPLRWPRGARVAVWVIPNIEHFLFDRPRPGWPTARSASIRTC